MEASSGVRKGAWTADEDNRLRKCIEKYGEGKWHRVPLAAGLNRCRKSCRLRWLNYLRPNIKRGKFTADEVDLIIRLHKLLGNRWSLIAGRLPERTSNDVKNYWNTHLRKKYQNCSNILPKNDEKDLHVVKVNVIRPQPRVLSKNLVRHEGNHSVTVDHNHELLLLNPDKHNCLPLKTFVDQLDNEKTWWQSLLDDDQMDQGILSRSISGLETDLDHFIDRNFNYNEVNNVIIGNDSLIHHTKEEEEEKDAEDNILTFDVDLWNFLEAQTKD